MVAKRILDTIILISALAGIAGFLITFKEWRAAETVKALW
jgi:hypothetical protein